LTEGADAYVVCSDCVAEFDRRSGNLMADEGHYPFMPPAGPVHLSLTSGEIEARLRKLLDDW